MASSTPPQHTSTSISTSQLAPSPSRTSLDSYIQIRLAALLTDPEAFGSTYARESAFTQAQWEERVRVPGRVTFYAHHTHDDHNNNNKNNNNNYDPDDEHERQQRWIGTLSVLTPAFFAAVSAAPPDHPRDIVLLDEQSGVGGGGGGGMRVGADSVYDLVGMWVDPAYRRAGVGRLLLERVIEYVRDSELLLPLGGAVEEDRRHGGGGDSTVASARPPRMIIMEVKKENMAARALYHSVGFVLHTRKRSSLELALVDVVDDHPPGHVWMKKVI